MKRILLVFLSMLFFVAIHAQNINDWRLSKVVYNGPGWKGITTYSYDNKWQVKEVKKLQDNKLVQVLKNFVYNSTGQLISYQEVNTPGDPKTYYLAYDKEGRLEKKDIQFFKNGKENYKTFTVFSRGAKKIIATKRIVTQKSGEATIVSEYQLDEKGNILVSVGDMITPTTNTSFEDYDNTKNPLLFIGSLVDKDVISLNNPGAMYFSGTSKLVLVNKTNADGLVTAIEEHYDDKNPKNMNWYKFDYVKAKPAK